jgi:hypothetical protein
MPRIHNTKLTRQNLRIVKKLYPHVTDLQLLLLRELSRTQHLSIAAGDMMMLDGRWYATHSGLLRLAQRKHCTGIQTELQATVSNPALGHWIFKATVLKSGSQIFVGYGDACPSNVSPLVHGAELRVAETRAVNRAIRKACAIGICSVEEIGSVAETSQSSRESKKFPAQPTNGSYGGPKVRDRLCELIRRHQLDASLVKSYATEFCGVKALRNATREQVEHFVAHLADWVEKDRNALLCQLNSYLSQKEGAA